MNLEKIEARIALLVARLESSNIDASELPAIFDAAWDLVECVVASAVDRRLTFSEMRKIMSRVRYLRSVVELARKD